MAQPVAKSDWLPLEASQIDDLYTLDLFSMLYGWPF